MCMIDACDERFRLFIKTPINKSRKDYKCWECSRTIRRGEPYLRIRSLDGESGWHTNHICQHCQVAIEWLTKNCGGVVVGMVGDDIEEHVEEYGDFGLARLRYGIRYQWTRRKTGKPMPVPRMPRTLEEISR